MLCSFKSKENATTKKKNEKDHSGSLENYSFGREKLLREVQSAIDNEISINWSELANSCNLVNNMGINPKNMGQVAKDFIMKSSEISGKHKINHHEIVQRKRIKGTEGKILMPVDVNESVLKKQLDTLIEQKEIYIGHLIMSKNIEKLFLKNN